MKVMKIPVAIFILTIFCAGFAFADTPCDPLASKMEYYQCKSVKRDFKVGLKDDYGYFCAEYKQIKPTDGCVIKDFDGKVDEEINGEKVMYNYIVAIAPASVTRNITDQWEFQCDSKGGQKGIIIGSQIGDTLPGFTQKDMPDKSNNDRASLWLDSLKAQKKRWWTNFLAISQNQHDNPPMKVTCMMYNVKKNTKLVELQGTSESRKATKAGPHGSNNPKGINVFDLFKK